MYLATEVITVRLERNVLCSRFQTSAYGWSVSYVFPTLEVVWYYLVVSSVLLLIQFRLVQ